MNYSFDAAAVLEIKIQQQQNKEEKKRIFFLVIIILNLPSYNL